MAARAACDTRPLSLKNTDSKSVAGVAGRSFRKAMRSGDHATQRGFVPLRDLTRNILETDAYARAIGLAVPPGDMRLMMFLDIEAAFLSVSRSFLRAALRHRGFPPGAFCLIKAMYHDNQRH